LIYFYLTRPTKTKKQSGIINFGFTKTTKKLTNPKPNSIDTAGGGAPVKKSIEDYRVLGIKTKYNNKWFSCEVGKQIWNKDSSKGKYWGNGKIVIPRVV
jgi:hypothetical protein